MATCLTCWLVREAACEGREAGSSAKLISPYSGRDPALNCFRGIRGSVQPHGQPVAQAAISVGAAVPMTQLGTAAVGSP
jgi:hypothetical protein